MNPPLPRLSFSLCVCVFFIWPISSSNKRDLESFLPARRPLVTGRQNGFQSWPHILSNHVTMGSSLCVEDPLLFMCYKRLKLNAKIYEPVTEYDKTPLTQNGVVEGSLRGISLSCGSNYNMVPNCLTWCSLFSVFCTVTSSRQQILFKIL